LGANPFLVTARQFRRRRSKMDPAKGWSYAMYLHIGRELSEARHQRLGWKRVGFNGTTLKKLVGRRRLKIKSTGRSKI